MKLDDDVPAHFLNLDFSEKFLGDRDTAPLCIELPYPINKPFSNVETDRIHQFHEKSANYSKKLYNIRRELKSVEGIMNQKFSSTHATIPASLYDLCSTAKCEAPFPCDYHPYYATGLLQDFQLNNNTYLIRSDFKDNLCISNVESPWKSINLSTDIDYSPIFGIETSASSTEICVMLRHKNSVNLLTFDDIKNTAKLKFRRKFKPAILDSKIDKEKLGVVTDNGNFSLFNIESNTQIQMEGDYNIQSAISFKFIDSNIIAILKQKSLQIIDCRSSDCNLFQPELLDSCNYLTAVNIDRNFIYLTSRHCLLRTDVRNFQNVEFCNHLMKSSPCYSELNRNHLCLSSQKFDEKVLFNGRPINSLPSYVPNICETLTECRLKRDILLRDKLEQRLQKSTIGVKLIYNKIDRKMCLYSANCVGEIFMQKISITEDSQSIESLYQWLQKLPQHPKTLYPTNIANMSNARFALNKRIIDENLRRFIGKSKRSKLFLNHFNNLYSKNNLGELAANFASIWDEEEEEDEREVVDLVPEVAPLDKVTSWIQSSYFFDQ